MKAEDIIIPPYENPFNKDYKIEYEVNAKKGIDDILATFPNAVIDEISGGGSNGWARIKFTLPNYPCSFSYCVYPLCTSLELSTAFQKEQKKNLLKLLAL